MSRLRGPERWLPLIYLAIALALVAGALPSSLRPPPQTAAGTPQIDPNAPPDPPEDSVVEAVSRGTSATAGSGGDGSVAAPGGGRRQDPADPPPLLGCPRGYGVPPRQTFSLYSAPCAKAFSGPNGGVTSLGVTATEIRLGLAIPRGFGPTGLGPLSDEPESEDSPQDTAWRAWQRWLNQNYEFYGRTLRFYNLGDDTPAAATREAERVQPFGVLTVENRSTARAMAERGYVTFAAGQDPGAHRSHAPYLWAWLADAELENALAHEYLCRRLDGNAAVHAGDPTMTSRTRTFGLIAQTRTDTAAYGKALAKRCGAELSETATYNLDDPEESQGDAMIRFKLAGVTTIVYLGDWGALLGWTRAADAAEYFPEWFVPGHGFADTNDGGRLATTTQWRNAFGFTTVEAARRPADTDCIRAGREGGGFGNLPLPSVLCALGFYPLIQIANGIQLAGPRLTPETFADGLKSMGKRFYPTAPWAAGGGYGPGDYSYIEDVAEIVWDPAAMGPDRQTGAYRYLNGGRRYRLGEIPSGQPVLTGGTTSP